MSLLRNKTLYHFVGWGSAGNDEANFKRLCLLLESDQVGRPGVAVMQLRIDPARGLRKGELIEQSITCYCDIPFADLDLHVAKYGRFGVGLDRDWLSRFGARPVAYVPVMTQYAGGSAGHFMLKEVEALLKGVHNHHANEPGESWRSIGAEIDSQDEMVARLVEVFHKDFLAFLKFYDGDLPIDHEDYFYAEREWRKYGPMPLSISLKEIVVPNGYEEELATRFPQHAAKLRPI